MITLSTAARIEAAPGLPLPSDLAGPLAARCRHTLDAGLGGMTCIVVVHHDDGADALAREIGGEVEAAWVDGARRLGRWTELVVCVGDTGFAYVIFVEDRADTLGHLCRELTA